MRHFLYLIAGLIVTIQLNAADYYWVGTTSTWTTNTNWRLSSTGGATPATSFVIGSADNVFITSGTVVPKLPTTALTILGLTVSASKSLDLNGSAGFNLTGSINLQSGSIINSSTTVTTPVGINSTDVTIGTSTGNLGFTIGAVSPNDKITLNITTAKFRNYGSLNCYANLNLVYKVNSTTPSDNFINVLGTNNYRGTFTLTINENTIAPKFGESAGTDTFWKAATINKYSNVDFSFGTTSDAYRAVFEEKLTLNGESKVGTNVSNLILGDQCNTIISLKKGLDLAFTKNTTIVLGKFSASRQPIIDIPSGNLTSLTLPASYTAGNFEAYQTNVSVGTTSVNLSTIGTITIDKGSTLTGGVTFTGNSLNINASTLSGTTLLTVSTPNLKLANTGSVAFQGDVTLTSPVFTTATLLGSSTGMATVFYKNLTVNQSTPITTYTNSNVNGFKYAMFGGASGNQVYTSNSIVPFYRLVVSKASGDLQLNSPLFMNYSVDNTTDTIKVQLYQGRIVGSETNRLIIYRSRYQISGYTNNSYIAAGLVFMSNDATNLPLKKFLPVGAATNYAPIEITSNTSNAKLLAVTYFNQNPQTLNAGFTGGALDVSNCEYWKVVEVDANLAALAVANLFDLDKVTLPYINSRCTKISQTNHAVGYSFKNGSVYTPWEKLATAFVANSGPSLSYMAGSIQPSAKLLKQQPEMLVTFSYQNVLVLNTIDVYSNPCNISTAVDGNYAFTSGAAGTNAGIVRLHPEAYESLVLNINNTATESTPYSMNISIGSDGKPASVIDVYSNNSIKSENLNISNYTLTFKNSEVIPVYEQYVTNLGTDGVTLSATTFTITTPVGITPTRLEVYNGATLLGATNGTTSPPQAPNSALSVAGISATGSYRFILAVKDQSSQTLSITGYFLK